MPATGTLNCCKTCCCVFVVFINVLSIIFGVIFAILGILLLWGSTVLQTLSNISPADVGMNQTAYNDVFGHVNLETYYANVASLTGPAAGLLIAFGIIIVVVSCIGCFGACISIPTCLIIYAVCVGLLFVGQVIAIIIWFANSDLFKTSLRTTLVNNVGKFRGDGEQNFESVSQSMIQVMFGCCGIDNGTDFHVASADWNRTYTMVGKDNKTFTFNLTYPESCCKHNLMSYTLIDPYCPYNGSSDLTVSNHRVGCYEKVWTVLDTYWKMDRLFYSLAGCLGLEILLIVGAIVICHAKREQMREASGGHGDVGYKMVRQNV